METTEKSTRPEQSNGQVDGLLCAVDLAQTCIDFLDSGCSCHEAYKTRGKIDPDCEYCEVGQYILPKAKAVLEST